MEPESDDRGGEVERNRSAADLYGKSSRKHETSRIRGQRGMLHASRVNRHPPSQAMCLSNDSNNN